MKYLIVALSALVLFSCAEIRFKRVGEDMSAQFRVKDAGNVSFFSSADGYAEHKTLKDKDSWSLMFKSGKSFTYFLTVDGKTYLPDCPLKEYDDFGGQLCVFEEE